MKKFETAVNEGLKLVDELNQRFGPWFYVISADNLQSLQLKREDLVTAKNKPAVAPQLPTRPNILLDPSDSEVAPSTETPTDLDEAIPRPPIEQPVNDGQ
jgi:hypothetical protein